MNWQDALIEELAGPDIPDDALTAADLALRMVAIGQPRSRDWARDALEAKVERDGWLSAFRGLRKYYWPPPK